MVKGGYTMDMEQRIRTAAAYRGMTQAKLAAALRMRPQNFNQKLKRGTFSEAELQQIAEAMGATFVCVFEFPDGQRF